MNQISKTAALKLAQSAVSKPIGYGTSWTVVYPASASALSGTTRDTSADSYDKAVKARSKIVARLALELMGHDSTEVAFGWLAESSYCTSAADLLTAALADLSGPDEYRIENIEAATVNGQRQKLFTAYKWVADQNAYVHLGRFSAPARTAKRDLHKHIEA